MNYIQKTPFMELYEELSEINEEASLADIADNNEFPMDLSFGQITTTASCASVDALMTKIYAEFKKVLDTTNSELNLDSFQMLRPKGIMLYLDNSEFHPKAVRAYIDSGKKYNYPEGSVKESIDLTGSRLGFCFISNTIKDNPNFGDILIKQLGNYFGEVAIKSSAKLMQPKVGTQIRKQSKDNVFGVFIKYDKTAKIALADVCDEFSPSISIGKANEFIKNFNTSNDKSYKTCTASDALSEIQNAIELRNIAFYIPGLVTYYQSNATLQNRAPLLSLLSLFDCRVAQGKKSLQYLYNAGLQEDIIEKLGKDIGLIRNPKATRTYNVPDNEKYHYLLMPESTVGEITGETDFRFKGYLVDAKIYGNTASMQKYTNDEDKSSHGAHFLIVYLKHVNNEPRWRLLYRQDPNDSFKDWYKESATDFAAAKTLAALIETFPSIKLAEL
jgi:hypothetical protein